MGMNNTQCPYNWRNDWLHPWAIGCGGNEVPSIVSGKWYLYVWNVEEKKNYYYCFNDDLFITEKEFDAVLNARNLRMCNSIKLFS